MPFRELKPSYTVRRHGSEHVEEIEEEMIFPCPECQSTNIRDANDDDDTSADYICCDCGCGFDAYMKSELTRSGEIAEKICLVLMMTFLILAVACCIAGVVFLDIKKKQFGEETLPIMYRNIAFGISVGGLVLFSLLTALMAKLSDKI